MKNKQKSKKKSENISKTTTIRGLEEEYVPHSPSWGIAKNIFTSSRGTSIETLYEVVKKVPEVLGCVQALVEDIMADGWRFVGEEAAKKKTEKFQIKSNFYKILTNALFDLIVTGNAYILKLQVDKDKLKDLIVSLKKNLYKQFAINPDELDLEKEDVVFKLIDQNFKRPNDLQLLKASTVRINFDKTGEIKSYVQQVGGEIRTYRPKDIIHLSLINVGGQPYGLSPLEPALSDIGTLIFAKEYVGKYFENDGLPSFIFNLPESSPDDRNFKALQDGLKELKKKQNKFRSLVTTGKINVEQIKKFNRDMEFAKLITHFTQIVLIALGVPAYRVNYTIDVKESSAQNIGKIETGYYKKISFIQKIIEEKLNKELWDSFNVSMKFRRSYKIDEMREAQIIQILSQTGTITLEEARERIGLEPELPNGNALVSIGDDKAINFRRDKKRETGEDSKPEEPNLDNKVKHFDDAIEVTWDRFKLLVERVMPFDNANIFYIETANEYIILWSDGHWKYKTRVPKSEEFFVENLSRATKILL